MIGRVTPLAGYEGLWKKRKGQKYFSAGGRFWPADFCVFGASGIILTAFPLFNRASTSIAASIGRFEGGFEALFAGWITDRFGPKWIVFCGILVASISLFCMYFINSYWSFLIVWGALFGTGINIALAVPLDTAITNWFVKKRGVALSIKWMFSGISGVIILPLIAWLITIVGWRSTCIIGGLVFGVVGLPLVLFFLKSRRPEFYGLLPDGAKLEEKTADQGLLINRGIEYAAEVQEMEFTLKQALRTPAFWLLILVQAVYGLVAPAISVHCIPFLTDQGISPMTAASMMALMIGASIPARYVGGFIADRIEIGQMRKFLALAYWMQTLGMGLYMLHQTKFMIFVWFILYGFGMGVGITLNTSVRARYFGRKAFGTIQGTASLLLTPVGVAAPIYAGWVFDTTGSYISAFWLFTVLLAVSSAILPFVRPPKPPEVTG
jgi:sugar phosphate permease